VKANCAVAEKIRALDRLLLLAGEKDAVLSPTAVRRAGEPPPNARGEVVTDAPHSMYWERPDRFNDAIRRFLREAASA
jgi:pimeloyl-ACP methyl ester carboxylesterase